MTGVSLNATKFELTSKSIYMPKMIFNHLINHTTPDKTELALLKCIDLSTKEGIATLVEYCDTHQEKLLDLFTYNGESINKDYLNDLKLGLCQKPLSGFREDYGKGKGQEKDAYLREKLNKEEYNLFSKRSNQMIIEQQINLNNYLTILTNDEAISMIKGLIKIPINEFTTLILSGYIKNSEISEALCLQRNVLIQSLGNIKDSINLFSIVFAEKELLTTRQILKRHIQENDALKHTEGGENRSILIVDFIKVLTNAKTYGNLSEKRPSTYKDYYGSLQEKTEEKDRDIEREKKSMAEVLEQIAYSIQNGVIVSIYQTEETWKKILAKE